MRICKAQMKVVRELDREPDLGIGGFRVQGWSLGFRTVGLDRM